MRLTTALRSSRPISSERPPARFPKEARTKALLDKAKGAKNASVKFIAVALTPAASPAAPAKKKKAS